jgi:TPP-dependent pyruvate/acetoin dehydrogenase alpha subunit
MARASAPGEAASELSGPAQHGLELYRKMLVVRRFEEAVQSLFQKGEVHGTTHLYIGEEAGAIGVGDVLGEHDRVAGTYRGHGHALGVGVDPQGLLDEMLGRETGVCGGRAGSMNVIDLDNRLIGSFGIIGGSISAATGAALALSRQGDGGVAVAFFGEGTTNHGYFHECLNFAAVLRLPVLFVCENNRYGEFTPFEDVTAGEIAARPQTLGIPTETVDGMDVWAVREAADAAVRRARAGEGPQFIQSMTYRFVGHSRSDPAKYRKPGELEEWKARDPLLVARERLAEAFGVATDVVDGVDAAVAAQFEGIVERALAAPYPSPERDGAREFAPSGAQSAWTAGENSPEAPSRAARQAR